MTTATMPVTTADDTEIVVESTGSGTPVVLLHGGLNTARAFDAVLPTLSARYRCLAFDRRGYGRSSDATTHSFEHEARDVAAVLSTLDEPAHLLGHSSGAIAAATAALTDPTRLRSLVLYEPPLPGHQPLPDRWVGEAEQALQSGNPDHAVVTGLREGVGFPPELIEQIRSSPGWARMIELAPAWIREARSVVSLPVGVARFSALDLPTLLVTGSNTEPHHTAAIRVLAATLPSAAITTLAGQGHTALQDAPALFTDPVLRFLDEH